MIKNALSILSKDDYIIQSKNLKLFICQRYGNLRKVSEEIIVSENFGFTPPPT
jgi:hypothetical protein